MIALATGATAQTVEIRGRIVDKQTNQPVSEANITTDAQGTGTASDAAGYFRITVPSVPVVLRISHISYGTTEFEVKTAPRGLLIISIRAAVVDVEEVQVTGERLRILTKQDPFSIQEFAIDQQVIWFIGCINNQATQKRLFVANLYGDTLASIPVRDAENLFQDVFNNVHLICRDSAHQLFHPKEGNPIELLYPSGKNYFLNIMGDIEVALGEKLVYTREDQGSYSRIVYYIQEHDSLFHKLAVITDTAEAGRRIAGEKIDYLMLKYGIPELLDMWKTISRYTKQGSSSDPVARYHIPYELFVANKHLYLLNYLKDSLLEYNSNGTFTRALSVKFHEEDILWGDKYKNLTCLTDPVTQKVYVLEQKMTKWVLNPLNTSSGKTGAEIPLPDLPAMQGIDVYDNAVYFLYQEKLYPYYTRLYRYQL